RLDCQRRRPRIVGSPAEVQSRSIIHRGSHAGRDLRRHVEGTRMTGLRVRLRKEARLLFWAWCVVVFVGVLTWLPYHWISNPLFGPIPSLGFWIGIPLLATLSLGAEFQYGTLSLLLSQPNQRKEIWREKWIVMGSAVLSASVVYWFRPVVYQHELWSTVFAAVWMVTAACSATFWTLIGRSTIGGLILNLFQGFGMITVWNVAFWFLPSKQSSSETRSDLFSVPL